MSGEVRAVTNVDKVVSEAAKLGFKTILIPHSNLQHLADQPIEVIGVTDLQAALDKIVG